MNSRLNSRLLYAATVALSLISTLAMADEPAWATRAEVNADVQKAIANGTLQRTDYDSDRSSATGATLTREQVALEMSQSRSARKALLGPELSGTYNPYGTQLRKVSTLPRAQVKREVLEAAASGTLQRTDYDDEALVARRAQAHAASVGVAQRARSRVVNQQG